MFDEFDGKNLEDMLGTFLDNNYMPNGSVSQQASLIKETYHKEKRSNEILIGSFVAKKFPDHLNKVTANDTFHGVITRISRYVKMMLCIH